MKKNRQSNWLSRNKKKLIMTSSISKPLPVKTQTNQPSIKFLFWNIGKLASPFEEEILNVATTNEIEVIILAEGTEISGSTLIQNDYLEVTLHLQDKIAKWIRVFYKKNDDYKITHKSQLTEIDVDLDFEKEDDVEAKVNRLQLFEISGSNKTTLFACVHFPSKGYHDEISHMGEVPRFKSKIHALTKKQIDYS